MSNTAMTRANLIDLIRLLPSKEAVLFCAPESHVERQTFPNTTEVSWIGTGAYELKDESVMEESLTSSDDCWRLMKVECLRQLEKGWEPQAWTEAAKSKKVVEPELKVNDRVEGEFFGKGKITRFAGDAVFVKADSGHTVECDISEVHLAKARKEKKVPRIDKATGARNDHVSWIDQPKVKLSKADSIDKANKRILANEKARKVYADKKKAKKPSFASVKHDHFVKHGTYKPVIEDNPLGPFGVMYDQLMDLPKEKLVGMLCATLIVQKVVG